MELNIEHQSFLYPKIDLTIFHTYIFVLKFVQFDKNSGLTKILPFWIPFYLYCLTGLSGLEQQIQLEQDIRSFWKCLFTFRQCLQDFYFLTSQATETEER